MTACTPKEEVEWRSRLSHSPSSDIHLPVDPPLFSSLALNVKALGAVYGKPGESQLFFRADAFLGSEALMHWCHRHRSSPDLDTPRDYCGAQVTAVPGHSEEYERREGGGRICL